MRAAPVVAGGDMMEVMHCVLLCIPEMLAGAGGGVLCVILIVGGARGNMFRTAL